MPDNLSDADLELRLFPHQLGASSRPIPQPDWAYVHTELRRKGVTLALLWEEYRSVYPDGCKRCFDLAVTHKSCGMVQKPAMRLWRSSARWQGDILARLPDMTASQVPDLLPWNWKAQEAAIAAAA
ncbi:MAG: hypothetical protein PF480_08280 [Roseovarius sp.]|nr:hypothetical protein [Roseovarius sp.]